MNVFKTKQGQVVLFQKPNTPLILFFVFGLLSFAPGIWGYTSSWLATAYLCYWAYLEIKSGVNVFRKLLGIGVMIYLLYSRFLFKYLL